MAELQVVKIMKTQDLFMNKSGRFLLILSENACFKFQEGVHISLFEAFEFVFCFGIGFFFFLVVVGGGWQFLDAFLLWSEKKRKRCITILHLVTPKLKIVSLKTKLLSISVIISKSKPVPGVCAGFKL